MGRVFQKTWWTSIPAALLITASTAVIAQASPLTSSAWQASGPGQFTITQDANGGEAFGYNDNHDPYSPYSQKTFTFDGVAPDSESLSFNWDYSGMHSWFAAYAGAQAFADGPNGRTTVTLIPYRGAGGGFDFKEKSQLTIYKGYDYGFIVQGQNFDSAQLIQGTLTVDPAVTIPTTTASTDVQANAAGWYNKDVTVTLSATDQGGNVASTMYSLGNGQTWNTYTAPFVVSTEGNNTVQYYSTSTDGGQEHAQTLTIPLDKTQPTISINGDNGTYTVDQTVSISVSSSDTLSGVASTTGQTSISGPAYSFNIGANAYAESATDNAGNVANSSADFNVVVTFDGLANLTGQFVKNPGIARSLEAKLDAAKASAARGDTKSEDNQLQAFDNEVSAQTGKSISSSDATLLTRLLPT